MRGRGELRRLYTLSPELLGKMCSRGKGVANRKQGRQKQVIVNRREMWDFEFLWFGASQTAVWFGSGPTDRTVGMPRAKEYYRRTAKTKRPRSKTGNTMLKKPRTKSENGGLKGGVRWSDDAKEKKRGEEKEDAEKE